MASNLPEKILVVDNDEGVLNNVTRLLEPYKIQVVVAKDWESALYQFNHNKVDLALISLELNDLPGGALIQKWRMHEIASKRNSAFILSTSMKRKAGDEALLKELGDIALITKPIQIGALLSALTNALTMAKERQKLSEVTQTVIEPLLAQNKVEKALQIAVEKLEPIGERGLYQSALLHLDANKIPETMAKLKDLVEKDPRNMAYHNELGRLYLLQGDLAAAKKSFELADQIAPHNLDRLNNMTELYLKMQMPEESIAKMKELIALNPESQDMKYGMYEKVYNAGFAKQAQEFCNQTTTPKELVRHFNNRGVIFAKDSKYKDAIEEYAKAVRFIPGSKQLYRVLYNMALAHINLKTRADMEKAHELLLECLKLDPTFTKASEKLAITSKYAKTPGV